MESSSVKKQTLEDSIWQYTLSTSDDEEDLVQEPKDGSDKKYTELESPD